MIKKITGFAGVMLLVATSHLCYGQYLNKFYDYDSTYDDGMNIFVQPDGNFFITGALYDPSHNNRSALFNMKISADGSMITNKHILQNDSFDFFIGNPGEVKSLPDGGYISPVYLVWADGGQRKSSAGLVKYDSAGDTVFLKTYTDTAANYEFMESSAVMPDGGYLAGGGRTPNPYTVYSMYNGLLIRTDSLGNILWAHTYQRYGQSVTILSVIPIDDGRIVLGAVSQYWDMTAFLPYLHNNPWFMLLDNMGNIIRDTLYSNNNIVGDNGGSQVFYGTLYKDLNGGYIHTGFFDSAYTVEPNELQNFPPYIAHLDTNFRITWITDFGYSAHYGRRISYNVHQLKDSSYIVNGEDDYVDQAPYTSGWAANIDKNGKIRWSHNFLSDTDHVAFLTSMVQKPDGNLMFLGNSFNDTLPLSRYNRDVWLVGVDINGCILPGGCDPDTSGGVMVKNIVRPSEEIEIYPNPNSGDFTVRIPTDKNERVKIVVTNMVGEKMSEYSALTNTNTQIRLNAPPGIYFINCIAENSRWCGRVVVTR